MDAGFRVVSGGTDTHLMLLDVFSKGLRGKEAEQALDRARITVNKNAIPFDTNPPMNPSGIRLGSPAVTTRGFREAEMREVGALIAEVLTNIADEQAIAARAAEGAALDGAVPAVRLEARRRPGRRMALHIVIDARRIRDFGIGTYIRSLVHALGAHRHDEPLHPGHRAGGGAPARRPAGEFPIRGLRAQRPQRARSRRVPACFCAACIAGPGAHSAESRPAADDPALRGDHPRHGELFFEEETANFRMQLRRFRFAADCGARTA